MSAKLGKLSIGCSITLWCVFFGGNLIFGVDESLLLPALLISFLLPLGGVILAIRGLMKKESPRVYSIIGLILSLMLLSFWTLVFVDK